jgi:hypothetical protein
MTVPRNGSEVHRNPINHEPDPDGKLAIWRDEGGTLRYRYLRQGDALLPNEKRGTSHFATCPDGDRYRRAHR